MKKGKFRVPVTCISVLAALSLFVGCAGRSANPVLISQHSDDKKSCKAIEQDLLFIEEEITRLIPQTEKTVKNVALGVDGWFFMDLSKAEQIVVNAYRQRYNHLLILAGEKNC